MKHHDETTKERVESEMHSLVVAFWGGASDQSAATLIYRYSLIGVISFGITMFFI